MGQCRAAVILQRAKQRMGVDLIAGGIQIAAAVVAANIVAGRGDCADIIIKNTMSSRADVEDRVRYVHDYWSVKVLDLRPVIAHSGIIDARYDRAAIVVNAETVVADGAITHYCLRLG